MEKLDNIIRVDGLKFGVDYRAVEHYKTIVNKFSNCRYNVDTEYIIKRLNAIAEVYDRFSIDNKRRVKVIMDGVKITLDTAANVIMFVALRGEEGEYFNYTRLPIYKRQALLNKYKSYGINLNETELFLA